MATSPLLILDAQGAPRIEPSVSARFSFDITSATRFLATHDVVLMSYMEGGEANTLVPYIDVQELQRVYDPENLGILGADLANYLKTPSHNPDTRGAYREYVLRLGQPTPATLTLLDGASSPVMTLASRDAGTYTNKISVEVGTGTVVGKRVTMRFRQETTVLDNLQNAFHLAYTGNASTATMTITRTADHATRLQTALTGATDGSINLDLDLTQDAFGTIQQLVQYLAGQNGYRAAIDRYAAPLLPSAELDAVAGVNVRTPPALLIRYIGAGSACTMTVTNTTLTTSVTGGPGGQNLTLTFSDPSVDTLAELVASVASHTGVYTCSLGPNADPDAATPALLANVAGQDIRTATYSLTSQAGAMDYVSQAALGSIIFAINTRTARTTATRVTNAVNPPANRAQSFFAGGTNPVPTLNDWLTGLAVVEQEAMVGALMLPVTTDPVIQDAVLSWAIGMHTNHGAIFRPFLAPPDFTSVGDAKGMALGMNSRYAGLMFQPVVASSGVTEQSPLYPIAMYCGIAAGALPTVSATRAVLRCRALPQRAKLSKAVREDLLSNGVTVLEEVRGVGVRISLAVTTSLSDNRIDRIMSEAMAVDVIEQRIKAYCEPLIPHWALLDFLPTVKGQVTNALASLETDGIITKGIDQNGKILPAWLPVQVSIQAGIMKVVVHVLIGGEIDHILIFGTVGYQEFTIEIPAGA